jgi:hypothetical protein
MYAVLPAVIVDRKVAVAPHVFVCCTEKKGLKEVEKKVDGVWKKRLTTGDPFEAKLEKDRVRVPSLPYHS